MENASKALIIAGAILISIVIVSLGVAVISQNSSTGTQEMDQQKVMVFNNKFNNYIGKSKNARTVDSLIEAVSASNIAQSSSDECYITVKFVGMSDSITRADLGGNGDAITGYTDKVPRGDTYDITSSPAANGVIETITVKKHP